LYYFDQQTSASTLDFLTNSAVFDYKAPVGKRLCHPAVMGGGQKRTPGLDVLTQLLNYHGQTSIILAHRRLIEQHQFRPSAKGRSQSQTPFLTHGK